MIPRRVPPTRAANRAALAVLALLALLAVGCVPVTSTGSGSTSTSSSTSTSTSTTTSTSTSTSTTTSTTTTTTTGPPLPDELGFAVVGDAGNASVTQQQVADQIASWATTHRVDAVLTAGDNVYPDGDPADYAAAIDTPYAALAPRPFWPALGNHDVQTGHGADELAHLGITADVPGTGAYERDVTQGSVTVQLLFADSNAITQTQTTWLADRLVAGTFDWRVVLFHHPAWSCGPHGNNATVIAQWVPALDAHADLVLQGHDHLYEHFDRTAGDHTVPYLVTGGGGAPLYDSGTCTATPTRTAWKKRHHFLWIDATDTGLSVTVVARTGEVLDLFSLAA